MKNASQNQNRKINHVQLWLFLLLFTTAFFPLGVRGQQTFTCEFSNPDGNIVYSCASVVTATINMPAANNPIQQIQLIFPNSFEITLVDGLPFPPSTVPIPGGNYNGPYSGTDLLGQWIPVQSNASQMIVTLAYRSCDIYLPINAATFNTNHLYFDCKGYSGTATNITYNASLLPGNPGLQILGGAAVANNGITNIPQAVEVIGTPGGLPYNLTTNYNVYSAINDEVFTRYFDIIINSASIEEFELNISKELDVDEEDLSFVAANGLSILSSLTNSQNNFPNVGFGNYSLTFSNNPQPGFYTIPIGAYSTNGNVRKITLAQRVKKNCAHNGTANVSVRINCGSCNQQVFSITLPLEATDQNNFTTFDNAPSITLTSNSAPSNSICGTNFTYEFDYTYSNDVISRLNNFILPINTQSFQVQSVEVGDGNTFTTVPVNFYTINQPLATSVLNININGYFGTAISPPNPCFTNILPNSNPPIYGAWINTNTNVTHLVIKVNLLPIFQTQTPSCPDLPINLSRPAPLNECTLTLSNTCGGTAQPAIFPLNLSTPTLTGTTISANFPQNLDLAVSQSVPVSYEIQIPEQSPFEIMIDNVPQISCSTQVFQAVLSLGNGAVFGNNAITTATVNANGAISTITPTTNVNGAYVFDLPSVSANQGFYNYDLSFQLGSITCPPCTSCTTAATSGAYVYNLTVVAICQDCNPDLRRNIICQQNPLELHCPGTCESPVGFIHDPTLPDIQRITFGWENLADYEANPNAPLTLNDLTALSTWNSLSDADKEKQLNSVYPYDMFTYKAAGSVKPETTLNYTISTLGLELRYPQGPIGNNFLQLIAYEAVFTEVGNPTNTHTINNINLPVLLPVGTPVAAQTTAPITIPVDSYTQELQWEIGSLSNPVGLYQAGIDVNNNLNIEYTIAITCTFRLLPNAPATFYEIPITGQFVGQSNDVLGNTHDLTSCDPWHADLRVIIPGVQVFQNNKYTGDINLPSNGSIVGQVNTPDPSACKFGHAIGIRHFGGNGTQADFYPEYRPITSWPQQISAATIDAGTGFFPSAYTYSTATGDLEINATDPLLPPLIRQIPTNNLQGLVLTLKENCANPIGPNPTQNLPADLIIDQYAYINTTHLMNTPAPPVPPATLNYAAAIIPAPPTGTINCNNILTLSGVNPPDILTIPNANSFYDFSLAVPLDAVGVPFAIQIIPPSNSNVNITNINIPGSSQYGTWYIFSSGLPNTNAVACTLEIQIIGNNGCYPDAFDVDFQLQVYCNPSDIPSATNPNPVSCLSCTQTRTFQRGVSNLDATSITTSFQPSPSGCDFVFQLQLINPINQPVIDLSALLLNFSSGMILQSIDLSFSGAGSVTQSNFNGPYLLNQNSNGLTPTGIIDITANDLTLYPNETLTYTITMQLAEAFCNGLYDPSTALFGISLLGINECDDMFTFMPVNIDPTDLSDYMTQITQSATCCVPNPPVTVTHVCTPNGTDGAISVEYANAGPGVIVTIFRPELCTQLPCSWTTTLSSNLFTLDATNVPFGLGAGIYRLVVWDQVNGAFFEQLVVIEDHSFVVTVAPNNIELCSGAAINLNSNVHPSVSTSVPISSFTFDIEWAFNGGSPIMGATTSNYTGFATLPYNTNGTYTVTYTNDNGCTASANAVVNVITIPPPVVVGTTIICQTNAPTIPLYLNVNSPNSDYEYNWYDAPISGTLINVGDVYNTAYSLLTSSTIYYINATDDVTQCVSDLIPVPVTVIYAAITANSANPLGPVAVCGGSNVVLTAASVDCPTPLYQWYFDNGSTFLPIAILGATDAFYTVNTSSPNATGDYYVAISCAGCVVQSNIISITVDQEVTITGPTAACDLTAQYCLPSYFPTTAVLDWTLNGQSIPHDLGNPLCTTIDWSQFSFFGGIIEVTTNAICGSSGIVTFNINPCCDPTIIPTITEYSLAVFDPGTTAVPYNLTGNTYTITGQTFVIDSWFQQALSGTGDLVLNNCNVFMAEGNQIWMSPSKDLTLFETNIKACDYRHKGVKSEGGSTFTITNGNIEGADIAVDIKRGTLMLTDANFDKNLNHVYARESNVTVNGGNFNCSGYVVPVNSTSSTTQTTIYDIYLKECYTDHWAVDFLPFVNNATFSNAQFGISTYRSGLINGGCTFLNCTKGINVWNSTSYVDQDCQIGIAGTNTFDNCKRAIYTGGNLSNLRIVENVIKASSEFGIMVTLIQGRMFRIVNNRINDTKKGIYCYANGINTTVDPIQQIIFGNIINGNTGSVGSNYDHKGIVVKEVVLAQIPNANINFKVGQNILNSCRHAIDITNVSGEIYQNSIKLNNELTGITVIGNIPSDRAIGIALYNCRNSQITGNDVSCDAPIPATFTGSSLTTGFRVDNSPGCFVCSNSASPTGEISTPFEFYGNCNPTIFKLNNLDNATSRGLYMAGMPIGINGVNGTIIGKQIGYEITSFNPGNMTFTFSFYTHNNFWGNMNSGFYTDYNNVDGDKNKFYMDYTPLWPASGNNSMNNVNNNPNDPFYSFQSVELQLPTLDCGHTRMKDIGRDAFDDIALDSIIKLGGNDTSRYFGREFLYSQIKQNDSLANVTTFAQFKSAADNSNLKPINSVHQALVYPLDSVNVDSLNTVVAGITPDNNIEANYKEVFELALKNPELRDSIYSPTEIERLHYIAHLCPYVDGNAVYTARVILNAFEPDSTFYNYCEYAKKPDRASSERNSLSQNQVKDNTINTNFEYKVIPNPNNGTFSLLCPDNSNIMVKIYDSKGAKVFEQSANPSQHILNIDIDNSSHGIYNLLITTESKNYSIKFAVTK
jgi:hypothetical protein